MTHNNILKILISFTLLFTFSSCSLPIGSHNEYNSRTTEIHTTRGQELIDLQKAFDATLTSGTAPKWLTAQSKTSATSLTDQTITSVVAGSNVKE